MECLTNSENDPKVSTWLTAGRTNREAEKACEDTFLKVKYKTTMVFGLADGQSGKAFCKAGGKAALKVVAGYIARKTIPVLCRYLYIDEVQYEMLRRIRKKLAGLAEKKHADVSEFASTLVLFAYDLQTGMSLSVHLGDGGIIAQLQNGNVRMISPPENGLCSACTWLTTSADAITHLRLSFGSIRTFRRIMLVTDGADAAAHGSNLRMRTKELLRSGSRQDILQYLADSDPEDDAGCIIADFDDD